MAKCIVQQIRKATRRKFSAEEKIRIVLEGLHGETPISQLPCREGIAPTIYYRWSKAFLEAGKSRSFALVESLLMRRNPLLGYPVFIWGGES